KATGKCACDGLPRAGEHWRRFFLITKSLQEHLCPSCVFVCVFLVEPTRLTRVTDYCLLFILARISCHLQSMLPYCSMILPYIPHPSCLPSPRPPNPHGW
ncbi:unnamed protein product, partial [Discosporangium mesarthrocarpum]